MLVEKMIESLSSEKFSFLPCSLADLMLTRAATITPIQLEWYNTATTSSFISTRAKITPDGRVIKYKKIL